MTFRTMYIICNYTFVLRRCAIVCGMLSMDVIENRDHPIAEYQGFEFEFVVVSKNQIDKFQLIINPDLLS